MLGGAPFNVAWHLQGFGLQPLICSRIGSDPLADEILSAIDAWGMDPCLIQRDKTHPTGTVQVALENGQPSFDIVRDVAYDFISEKCENIVSKNTPPQLLYHGSLALRSDISRQTLFSLRKKLTCPVFVDINLRAPWWDISLLEWLLQGTTWLKLNQDELITIAHATGVQGHELVTLARTFLQRYQMTALIVTLGEKGAFIVDDSNYYQSEPVRVDNMVDAVGAGDGFSAVTIAGLIQGWEYSVILERASEFAARICEQRGAICQNREFYQRFQSRWV